MQKLQRQIIGAAALITLVLPLLARADFTLFGITVRCDPAANPSPGGGGCSIATVLTFIHDAVLFVAQYIAVPLAILFLAVGAVMIMTARDNASQVEAGKKTMTAAAIGIGIIFAAYLIVTLLFQIVPLSPDIQNDLRSRGIIQ